jgi:hypothetical protein
MMLAWTPGMVLFAYFLWKETGGQRPHHTPDRDVILPESGLSQVQPGTSLLDF